MFEPGCGLGVPMPWIPSGRASPTLIIPEEKSSPDAELLTTDSLRGDSLGALSASVVYCCSLL